MFQEFFLRQCMEDRTEDSEVRAVIFECKFEMVRGSVAGPILRGKDFFRNTRGDADPVKTLGRHKRSMPIRNDVEVISVDQGFVASRAVGALFDLRSGMLFSEK